MIFLADHCHIMVERDDPNDADSRPNVHIQIVPACHPRQQDRAREASCGDQY